MVHVSMAPPEVFRFLDVIKTGWRYQVIDTRDNAPVGRTFPTRADAWDFIHTLDAQAVAALGRGVGADTVQKQLEALKPIFDDVFGDQGPEDLNKAKISPPKTKTAQTKS